MRLASDSIFCGVDGISEGFVEVEVLVVDETGAGGTSEKVLEFLR